MMVHQYKKNDNNIIIDVGSGSIHLVDDVTYDIINEIKKKSILEEKNLEYLYNTLSHEYEKSNIESAFDEVKKLYIDKKLFTNDDYEDNVPISKNDPIKAMCLHVAHDCNLRCKYCFASTGEYDGNRSLMSFEIGKKAIDFLIEKSGKRRNLEIDFFGGEPLMNLEVVKQIVEYAKSKEEKYNKNFRFTITTNGVLLSKDVREYLNNKMYNIVLSLDGRKEVNDTMRPAINGKGSYDIIIDNIINMAKARGDKQYYVRGTFTKENMDFSNDVMDMYNTGLSEISIEPVVTNASNSYALTEEDIPFIEKEYDKLANKIIEKNDDNLHFFHFNIDLSGGPCIIKRLRGCGAGNEYVAISPDGKIYPCHQFVGKKEWQMGSLVNNSFDNNIKDIFAKNNIYTKDNCKDCWAKFYCSGGCHANSVEYAGDITKTHTFSCMLEKARVETAIMLKIEQYKMKQKI